MSIVNKRQAIVEDDKKEYLKFEQNTSSKLVVGVVEDLTNFLNETLDEQEKEEKRLKQKQEQQIEAAEAKKNFNIDKDVEWDKLGVQTIGSEKIELFRSNDSEMSLDYVLNYAKKGNLTFPFDNHNITKDQLEAFISSYGPKKNIENALFVLNDLGYALSYFKLVEETDDDGFVYNQNDFNIKKGNWIVSRKQAIATRGLRIPGTGLFKFLKKLIIH
jgi:hypothetical protein